MGAFPTPNPFIKFRIFELPLFPYFMSWKTFFAPYPFSKRYRLDVQETCSILQADVSVIRSHFHSPCAFIQNHKITFSIADTDIIYKDFFIIFVYLSFFYDI